MKNMYNINYDTQHEERLEPPARQGFRGGLLKCAVKGQKKEESALDKGGFLIKKDN